MLTALGFIHPQGELQREWFGDSLETDLAVWITNAQSLTTDEARQRAYVYWRAYDYLTNQQVGKYSQRTVGDASYQLFGDAFHLFPRKRDEWRAKYDGSSTRAHSSTAPVDFSL